MTTLWRDRQPLILASGSTARRAMLEAAGIPLEVRPAAIDERALEAEMEGADASEVAVRLARAKARAVAAASPGRLVLGADQTLSFEGRVFYKPGGLAEAREQLSALRGRTHALHAAVCVVGPAEPALERVDTARLTMRPFTDGFLDAYLAAAGAAVERSVGAYQLEGLGSNLFERVEGDYFTVLGLPLLPVLAHLRAAGVLAE